ncbi:quinol dehydrogenase [Draconibacterium sediminis]|uniref:Quinol dehydrogenase n=1 Tax=Draconibacterium sediminis TaxID=1544798 RepID=A0A0D8JA92_9BACT|nr:quinol dehydrogenase [Draconibacterium sediminis]
MSRRKLLGNLPKGLATLGLGGLFWGSLVKETSAESLVLRPPGALPEKDFLKACLKCGQCVEACPYDTLKLAPAAADNLAGTPYFEPRAIPCYMCTDFPCIKKCPSEALSEKEITIDGEASINNSKMGLAVVHKESCIAYEGIHCSACYRACPLMGEAIQLIFDKNEVTQKHANLKPVVNGDICTGCGLCEHACIMEESAIKVLPPHVIEGKAGTHYIKSWDPADENRLTDIPETKKKEDVESTLDYLNDDNLLDDE